MDPRHSVYSLASASNTPPMYDGRASSTYFAEKDVEQGSRQSTYQDFNNEGPRRSYYDLAQRPQSPGSASQLLTPSSEKQLDDLDLAHAPVLGNDWSDGEAKREHESRRKTIARERKQKVADFTQGRRKLCGWLGWRQGVFIVFALLVALGVTLFFVVPRVPSLQYDALKPMTADGGDATFLHLPGNFSFTGELNLAVDAKENWLPLVFSSFSLVVKEVTTNAAIGRGTLDSGTSVPGRKLSPLSVPVSFSYASTNDTDPTWQALYQSCKHNWPGQPARPSLAFRVLVDMGIRGKIGTTEVSAAIAPFTCPFELSGNV